MVMMLVMMMTVVTCSICVHYGDGRGEDSGGNAAFIVVLMIMMVRLVMVSTNTYL